MSKGSEGGLESVATEEEAKAATVVAATVEEACPGVASAATVAV